MDTLIGFYNKSGYAIVAIILVVLASRAAVGANSDDLHDMETYSRHTRQDVRFACYLLIVIAVMLGIVADRVSALAK